MSKEFDPLIFHNVLHSIHLHKKNNPCLKIYVYDDTDCNRLIKKVYEPAHKQYNKIKYGAYKGDLCRGAMLYKYGGLYLDVDIKLHIDALRYFKDKVYFVSCD